MNIYRVLGGGIAAGVIFYLLSFLVWALFKFLPVVPFAIAIPMQGLGQGWYVQHFAVSVGAGVFWALGYAIYGRQRPGGWLYGATVFIAALFPSFAASFAVFPDARGLIAYGMVVSLIGALLGGRAVAMIARQ